MVSRVDHRQIKQNQFKAEEKLGSGRLYKILQIFKWFDFSNYRAAFASWSGQDYSIVFSAKEMSDNRFQQQQNGLAAIARPGSKDLKQWSAKWTRWMVKLVTK